MKKILLILTICMFFCGTAIADSDYGFGSIPAKEILKSKFEVKVVGSSMGGVTVNFPQKTKTKDGLDLWLFKDSDVMIVEDMGPYYVDSGGDYVVGAHIKIKVTSHIFKVIENKAIWSEILNVRIIR